MQENKSKAAPVGEREAFERLVRDTCHVDEYTFKKDGGAYFRTTYANTYDGMPPREMTSVQTLWNFYQAGAAHQRQQAQDAWESSYSDYDRSIHANPDAKAWADLFVATFPGLADKHELMISWFANAMMAMHDYLKAQQPQSAEPVGWRDPAYDWSTCSAEMKKAHPERTYALTDPLYTAAPSAPKADDPVKVQLLDALEKTAAWIEQLPVPTVGAAGQLVKIDKAIAAARKELTCKR